MTTVQDLVTDLEFEHDALDREPRVQPAPYTLNGVE